MTNNSPGKFSSLSLTEKNSIRLLMQKMGMSQKELQEIKNKYGVSAAQLLEIMQLSKYQFVYTGKAPGQCEPCQSQWINL